MVRRRPCAKSASPSNVSLIHKLLQSLVGSNSIKYLADSLVSYSLV